MTVRKIFIRFCNNIRHFSNEINKRGGGNSFCGGWNFSKSVSMDSTFITEMRVGKGDCRPRHGLQAHLYPPGSDGSEVWSNVPERQKSAGPTLPAEALKIWKLAKQLELYKVFRWNRFCF